MWVLLTIWMWLGAAWAQDCPEGETIVVRYMDAVSAPAYRPAIRAALARLVEADGCPLFAPEVGVLDWVEVDAVARKETEIRGLFKTLQGISSADADNRRRMADAIKAHTSGYGASTEEYLEHFSRARRHLTVTQSRGEGWTNVYLELREAHQLLPRNSAFTFDESTPEERDARVSTAVLELFPESNRAPSIHLVTRQETGHSQIVEVAGASDTAPGVLPGIPVIFDATDTNDPETSFSSLAFSWWVDGRRVHSSAPYILEHTFLDPGDHVVKLQVTAGSLQTVVEVPLAVVEPRVLESATAGIQVLGRWHKAPIPITFAVDPSASARQSDTVRYRWTQLEAPSLTCLDVLSLSGPCEEDTEVLIVDTDTAKLQLMSQTPGLYRFSVVEVVEDVPSLPVETSTEAIYTAASIVRGRFDLNLNSSVLVAGDVTQFNYFFEVGIPGLHVGLGSGTSHISGADQPAQVGFMSTSSTQVLALFSWASERFRQRPMPAGGYLIAWSPTVDIHISSHAVQRFQAPDPTDANDDTQVNVQTLSARSLGPQINFGRWYGVLAFTSVNIDRELAPKGTNRHPAGMMFQIGAHTRYESNRLVYPASADRLARFAAYRTAEKARRRQERDAKKD